MAKQKTVLTGIIASPGSACGRVKIAKSPKEILKTKKEEIIVAPFLTPDFIVLLRKNPQIKGIITDRGGSTSHAAILAREFRIPYIAGARTATRRLKKNSLIILDAESGTIYEV